PLLRRPAWQVAVAAAAALIAIVMAVPPARSAVLEWLGFASVRIERRVPERPPLGAGLALGRPVALDDARERAGFPLGVPEVLGPPDAVYVAPDPAAGTRVDFVYGPREGLPRAEIAGVGLLITQFEAVAEPVIEKTVGPAARIERLRVAGDPAFFISGAVHGFAYTGHDTAFEPQRLAGNTLLVERRDGMLLRLEGDLPRAAMTRIAASVR
ncbi:MAG: hypothetical protein ACRDPC_27835, partial [Solirubrobacteraceae bacterium]